MKCTKCRRTAVIKMPQHNLALCEDCFPVWVQDQVVHTISKFNMFRRSDRVLVAVSGGKDSLALWDILLERGYRAEGFHINLGIQDDNHSDTCEEIVRDFAKFRGNAILHVVNLKEEYGETIGEVSKRTHRGRKPCALCGMVKRHLMNRFTRDSGFEVVATGHNVDDECSVLFQNVLRWQKEYLVRQAPVLPGSDGLARKAKPLCRLYERETAAYCIVRGIEYVREECPYVGGSTTIFYKHLLNELEGCSPGSKFQFYWNFLRAREEGFLVQTEHDVADLHPCDECGQPTTAPGLCAFCRLWSNTDREEPAA